MVYYVAHVAPFPQILFFRLWSVTVELVAALCSWPTSDNDAVLHTSEDFSVSQSILYLA